MTHLIWFRNDLRINDNTALHHACMDIKKNVIGLFIATPQQWKQHNISSKQIVFLYKNLLKLKKELTILGIPLLVHECNTFKDSLQWLKSFCLRKKIQVLFYNRQYELNEKKRDENLKNFLKNEVIIKSFDDSVFFTPGSILNKSNNMYKVFTSFRKIFIQHLKQKNISVFSIPKKRKCNFIFTQKKIKYFDYAYEKIEKIFSSGEKSGLKKLNNFCKFKINYYHLNRNNFSIASTSMLSPYLTLGIISQRQCLYTLIKKNINFFDANQGAISWLNEFIWREFYRHAIAAYPFLCMNKPFITWTEKIKWDNNKAMIFSWKNGKTGYPIVDAAMRQLNQTGWIHNRLRMISASFLVKNLIVDWRIGERYFMSRLIDGDFASNNGGWQCIASTGISSLPFFQIFNPLRQGRIFDLNGIFIRHWIPELAKVPNEYIHNPHLWCAKYNYKIDYPLPIINIEETNKKIKWLFKKARYIKSIY